MHIIFGQYLDGSATTSLLGSGVAVAGQMQLGPIGLLDRLELELGLGGVYPETSQRITSLARRLPEHAGFWSRSAEADALATARSLLHLRDELMLHGWDGEGSAAPRITDLAALFADAYSPGLPDRLLAVEEALTDGHTQIERIEHVEPLDHLSPLWQRVFAALEKTGVELAHRKRPRVEIHNDISRSWTAGFRPRGDGSLQMLRPYGVVQAAEHVAAWLAALSDEERQHTVIIRPDEVLDAALHRFGLPSTGSGGVTQGELLQVLPLVIALARAPVDPHAAHHLLSLSSGIVPWGTRQRLQEALEDWPAVGSACWEACLQNKALEQLGPLQSEADELGAQDMDISYVEELVRDLFERPIKGDEYPKKALFGRIRLVEEWAQLERDGANSLRPNYDAVLEQCDQFKTLARRWGRESFTEVQVRELLRMATDAAGGRQAYGAEAGMHWLGTPGAMLEPADRVIWWNFTRASMPSFPRLPLTNTEWETLRDEGVKLRTPAEFAVHAERAYTRPWYMTRAALLLICPQVGQDGSEQFPHAMWDVITAHAGENGVTALHVNRPRQPEVPRAKSKLLPLPTPTRDWRLPKGVRISTPERLAVTSIEQLIRCPFRWLFEQRIRLGSKNGGLPTGPLLAGRLAHRILLDELLGLEAELPESGEQAERRAEELFDTLAPKLAAEYYLPGYRAELEDVRRAIVRAAGGLVRLIHACGWDEYEVECKAKGEGLGTNLSGRLDLRLGEPTKAVLDLKWSGKGKRHDELTSGTAVQLAAYAHLKRRGKKCIQYPAVAYFIVQSGEILTCDDVFGGTTLKGPSFEDTWAAAEATCAARFKELQRGRVAALGNPDENGEGVVDKRTLDGTRIEIPPCEWCDYASLCGQQFGGQS